MAPDQEMLQGKWRQVAFAENGLTDPPDAHGANGATMTMTGASFHVAIPGGATLIEGTFTFDATTSPKSVDWIDANGEDAGKSIPAIYELSSTRFRFTTAEPDEARPRDFAGGQGIAVRAFVRA